MSKLDDVIKDLNKKFKSEIVHFDNAEYKERKMLKFDVPGLNYPFYGGMPKGIICELIGAEAAGKSSTAMMMVASGQKQFMEEYNQEYEHLESIEKKSKTQLDRFAFLKDNGHSRVLWIDAENTFDNEYAERLGIDVGDLLFIKPQEQSAEDIFDMVVAIVESGGVGLVVLDSIGVLFSNAEQEKAMGESTYGGIAKPLTKFSKMMVGICAKHSCTLIGINQLRDKMNSTYGGTTGVGGRGWRHYCSIRIELRKGKYFDDSYKDLTTHPDTAHGNYVEGEVVKNKICPNIRRMFRYTLNYTKGKDIENDVFDMAVAFGIIDRSGAWFGVTDARTNDYYTDENGVQVRFQGKTKFIEYLCETPSTLKVLLEEVNRYIEKR